MPSSWNTCSARANPPTWLFSVNIMEVLSTGEALSCRFDLSFNAADVYSPNEINKSHWWVFKRKCQFIGKKNQHQQVIEFMKIIAAKDTRTQTSLNILKYLKTSGSFRFNDSSSIIWYVYLYSYIRLCYVFTTKSSWLCKGLPSLTAHSCSPLRYNHKPNKPLPEPLIFHLVCVLSLSNLFS